MAVTFVNLTKVTELTDKLKQLKSNEHGIDTLNYDEICTEKKRQSTPIYSRSLERKNLPAFCP